MQQLYLRKLSSAVTITSCLLAPCLVASLPGNADETRHTKPQCDTVREALGTSSEWDLQHTGWVMGHKSATNQKKNIFTYDMNATFSFKEGYGHYAAISGPLVFKEGHLENTWPDEISITSPAILELDDVTLTIFMGPDETDHVKLRLVSDGCRFIGNGILDKYQERSLTYTTMTPLYREAEDEY